MLFNYKISYMKKLYLITIFIMFVVAINSCKKEEEPEQTKEEPEQISVLSLTTEAVSNISETTATSGGNITDDGGSDIIVRGVCYSTNTNPTIDDFDNKRRNR